VGTLLFQSKLKNCKKPQIRERMCINAQTAAMDGKFTGVMGPGRGGLDDGAGMMRARRIDAA
ncbi:MAG TPA: hypothetical protein VE035_09285, partial [Puia sp.]|nr:hypothetical protein [Puia sp.]